MENCTPYNPTQQGNTSIPSPEQYQKEVEKAKKLDEFRKELTHLLNRYSVENRTNTPDFIIADYLIRCLDVFNFSVKRRNDWYSDREV